MPGFSSKIFTFSGSAFSVWLVLWRFQADVRVRIWKFYGLVNSDRGKLHGKNIELQDHFQMFCCTLKLCYNLAIFGKTFLKVFWRNKNFHVKLSGHELRLSFSTSKTKLAHPMLLNNQRIGRKSVAHTKFWYFFCRILSQKRKYFMTCASHVSFRASFFTHLSKTPWTSRTNFGFIELRAILLWKLIRDKFQNQIW